MSLFLKVPDADTTQVSGAWEFPCGQTLCSLFNIVSCWRPSGRTLGPVLTTSISPSFHLQWSEAKSAAPGFPSLACDGFHQLIAFVTNEKCVSAVEASFFALCEYFEAAVVLASMSLKLSPVSCIWRHCGGITEIASHPFLLSPSRLRWCVLWLLHSVARPPWIYTILCIQYFVLFDIITEVSIYCAQPLIYTLFLRFLGKCHCLSENFRGHFI